MLIELRCELKGVPKVYALFSLLYNDHSVKIYGTFYGILLVDIQVNGSSRLLNPK